MGRHRSSNLLQTILQSYFNSQWRITSSMHEALEHTLASMRERPSITRVDLSHKSIGDMGALKLADTMTEIGPNSSLEYLDLRDNNINQQGACALAATLKTNSALQRLSLALNSIGVDGALGLSAPLGAMRTVGLICLDLDFCDIRELGVQRLATALETNQTLEELNLANNGV